MHHSADEVRLNDQRLFRYFVQLKYMIYIHGRRHTVTLLQLLSKSNDILYSIIWGGMKLSMKLQESDYFIGIWLFGYPDPWWIQGMHRLDFLVKFMERIYFIVLTLCKASFIFCSIIGSKNFILTIPWLHEHAVIYSSKTLFLENS